MAKDNYLASGTTSMDEAHDHQYSLNGDGDGWAFEAINPVEPRIFHKHKIIGWVVQSAKSECYPNCEEIYGVKGAPPHVHTLASNTVEMSKGGMIPKKSKGGYLRGPSHQRGGIPGVVEGTRPVELASYTGISSSNS